MTSASVSIRPLAATDATPLARCFERCYGDTYVTSTFYDPAAIKARITAGQLRSVVAVDPSGEIVGHMGLSLRRPGALTADAGNTIVDPRYRNQRLAARLGAGLLDVSREIGLVGFHHYATTAHPIMQKLAAHGGGVETGIMLEYVPAGTHYRDLADQAEGERAAAIIIYQPIAPAPSRDVFLPPPYAATASRIYERAQLVRSVRDPAGATRAGDTTLESSVDPNRGMLRLEVDHIGTDLGARLEEATATNGTDLLQVDLSLGDPATAQAVDALRRRGFYFCAILPEYRDGDVLRLQRLPSATTTRTVPDLVTEHARELLTFLSNDQASVSTSPT